MSVDSPPFSPAPDEPELSALLARLEAEGRTAEVIQLATLWEAEQHPRPLPRAAGLAAVRALLALRMVDAAWARLRALAASDPHDAEVLALTAEAYLERGWPDQARALLARVPPHHPAQPALAARAAGPPLRLPPDTAEVERSGTPGQQLALAERLLAAGSLPRAAALLERLRRLRPSDPRVQELLWAARGELRPPRTSLAAWLAELSLQEEELPEGDEQTAEWEGGEHTESLSPAHHARLLEAARALPAPASAAGFPLLFRKGQEAAQAEEEAEVTVATPMARPEDLIEPPTEEITGSGLSMGDEEPDTRIMEVISSPLGGRRLVPISAAPSPRPARSTVDLRSLSLSADPDTEQLDQEEDEERVVLLRSAPAPKAAGAAGAAGPARAARRRPIAVIEKHPIPIPAPAVPAPVSAPPPPRPPSSLPESEIALEPEPPSQGQGARPPAEGPEADEADWPRRRGGRSLAGPALVVAGLCGLLALGIGGGVAGMRAWAAGQLRQEAASALAVGSFAELRGLAAVLEEQVAAGKPPMAARTSVLALVEAVLWAEYTGDIVDREQARAALAAAEAAGARGEEVALAAGHLALAAGDMAEAERQVGQAGGSPEARYLRARIALEQGRPEQADAAWSPPPDDGQAYRYQGLSVRLGAEAAAAGGDPLSPELQVLALEQGGGTAEQAEALLASARQVLSPRQRGRLLAIIARHHAREGRAAMAQRAWQQALEADAYHPGYLAAVADGALAQGAVREALALLERCLAARPADPTCQRHAVVALLELDRLPAARALAEASGQPALLARVEVASGDAPAALARLAPQLEDIAGLDGWTLLVAGMARVEAGAGTGEVAGAAQAERWLDEARRRLAEGGTPLEQLLSQRAAALLLQAGAPAAAPGRAEALLASEDPLVHLALADYFAASRRPAEAAGHRARAEALAGERALAWLRLAESVSGRRPEQAQELWRRYLDLQPEGPRAEQARARMAVPE